MALNDAMKNRYRRAIRVIMVVLAAVLLVSGLGVPVANNALAMGLASDIASLTMPADTEVLDSTSLAGRMLYPQGSVQYIGAVLLRSERSLDELKAHFSSCFSDASQTMVVCRVQSQTLEIRDGVTLSFRETVGESGYYAVYVTRMGGHSLQWLLDMDMRG